MPVSNSSRFLRTGWGSNVQLLAEELRTIFSGNINLQDIDLDAFDARYLQAATASSGSSGSASVSGGGDTTINGKLTVNYSGSSNAVEVNHTGAGGFGLKVNNRGASIVGDTAVAGALSASGSLTVTGATSLTTLACSGAAVITGGFTGNHVCSGTFTASGFIGDLTGNITGNTTVTGDLTVNGQTFLQDAQGGSLALVILSSSAVSTGELFVSGTLHHDGDQVGVYGNSPVNRPAAYEQFYSTAVRTHDTMISEAVPGDLPTDVSPWGYASATQAEAIVVNYNRLRSDVENMKQVLNQVIDDLQQIGWLQ